VLVRATGFASLAFAGSTATLLASMILSALGGALFEAPYQASIAALTTTANRARYYAISNWTSGVATALGPLIGIALLRFDFQRVCLAAAACFLLNYAIALFLPSVPVVTGRSLTHGFRLVLAERRFVMLTVVMMGYWFVASQLNISFALQAYALTGSQDSVGVMFVLSAGLTIAFQYALVRVLEGRVRGARLLVVGVAIMSCAAGAVAFAPGFASFLTCVGVFAVGAILTRPTQQALAASMARPEAFGTFLGFAALGQAVGGGIGNVAGGWLVDVATATAWTALPWLAFNAVGLLTAMGLLVLTRRPSAADSTSSQTTAIPVRRV
jgi:DHA1 family multidrug resistance protein-like MFS transporter